MPVCVLSVLTAKVAEECLDKVCAGSWSISEKQFFSVAVRPTPEAPAERSGRSRRVSVLCGRAQKCQEFGAFLEGARCRCETPASTDGEGGGRYPNGPCCMLVLP